MKEIDLNYLPEVSKDTLRKELIQILPLADNVDSMTATGFLGRTKYSYDGEVMSIILPIYKKKYEVVIVKATMDELKEL
jgi:hypothetical protein